MATYATDPLKRLLLISENTCTDCTGVEDLYRVHGKDNNFYIVHAERSIVKGKSSPKKKRSLDQITTRVSALRNSKGGAVLVHLKGQVKGDRFLQYFDEFIDKTFCDLIEDGESFVNTYTRQWLSELSQFGRHTDFVLVKVKRTRGISTVDFNTKFRKDFENETPTTLNILKLLSKPASTTTCTPRLLGLPDDVQSLHECRNIELKAFWPNYNTLVEIADDVEKFVAYIWHDLKLRLNLTSMSKLKDGGSVYFGVMEDASEAGSKCPYVHGFTLVKNKPENKPFKKPPSNEKPQSKDCPTFQIRLDAHSFQKHLERKISSETLLLKRNGSFADVPANVLTFGFHEISNTVPPKHVLEVAIGYVDGVMFYDKRGPRTYTISEDKISLMGKEDWFRKLQEFDKTLGNQIKITS